MGSKIDTHSHFITPSYRAVLEGNGHTKVDGMPAIPAWNEEDHLQLMKQLSISKSILSITSPGTHIVPGDDTLAHNVTRECNTFAASLVQRHPASFGFWASLPLPDVAGSLDEMAYALDTLHADGVAMLTNHHGRYLGDALFDPVFDELNRRKGTVFIHPTGLCTHTPILPQYPSPMFEYLFDTARAVINLFLSGTVARCPNITFILSHAGGCLPAIIERFTSFATSVLILETKINADIVKETMQRQFYFDLAGFVFPDQLHGLLRCVDSSRLLYGSDYPFTPARGVAMLAMKMDEGLAETFKENVASAVYFGNAARLLKM